MKFAFCLETLYTDLSFLQRLAAAQRDGIEWFEIWSWKDKAGTDLDEAMAEHSLKLSNLSANRLYGMIDPDERTGFLQEIEQSAYFAQKSHCPVIMMLAQALQPDGRAALPPPARRSGWKETCIENMRQAALIADRFSIDLVLEPLNDRLDHPGYLLNSSQLIFQLVQKVAHPRVKVLYDVYHMAMMGENVIQDIEEHLDSIGYFHLADIPGRTEPGIGEIPYDKIMNVLKQKNWQGVLGFEFFPSTNRHQEIVKQLIQRFVN
jgi:hydroxypyruvate isomerase